MLVIAILNLAIEQPDLLSNNAGPYSRTNGHTESDRRANERSITGNDEAIPADARAKDPIDFSSQDTNLAGTMSFIAFFHQTGSIVSVTITE